VRESLYDIESEYSASVRHLERNGISMVPELAKCEEYRTYKRLRTVGKENRKLVYMRCDEDGRG